MSIPTDPTPDQLAIFAAHPPADAAPGSLELAAGADHERIWSRLHQLVVTEHMALSLACLQTAFEAGVTRAHVYSLFQCAREGCAWHPDMAAPRDDLDEILAAPGPSVSPAWCWPASLPTTWPMPAPRALRQLTRTALDRAAQDGPLFG